MPAHKLKPPTRLSSYCIPTDDGAAPNPFWGYCTLAICKPAIRRVAQVGDWVIGTGSCRAPGLKHGTHRDLSGHLVYAMKVTMKLSMKEYDKWAKQHCPRKIPQWTARDHRRRLGDAIYDFRFSPPHVRASVHNKSNRRKDLRGKYVLISDHFYYFGDKPIRLPQHLRRLAQQRQGHRSRANDALVKPFLAWLHGLGLKPGRLYGSPQKQLFNSTKTSGCKTPRMC